jgi:uncharacterized lipoprotein YajG
MKSSLLLVGVLLLTGCATTYTSKKAEIKAAILAEIPVEIDRVIAVDLAECLATEATAFADELGCEVPKEYTDLREPLAQCVQEKGAVDGLRNKLIQCLNAARKALEESLPPQPA